MRHQRHKAKSTVITVGEGRGFVVKGRAYFADGPHDRLIITAAHCLPRFPPCHGASYLDERTYKKLLAPLGGKPSIWAECLFADPIADIAILGSPDNQALWKEAEAYEALVESATPLPIADAPERSRGWMMSLDGKWFRCTVEIINNGPLWINKMKQPIEGGMSGSPIISDDVAAIGVVCLSDMSDDSIGATNSRLVRSLPRWFLQFHNFIRDGVLRTSEPPH